MPTFSLRHPYFIIVLCLFVCVLGLSALVQMPVDMFPPIDIPVVLVATFYNGMPPEQMEADITDTFERFFTLGSGIDHMESRSMAGVSLIKIYFQPGSDANADVTQISNLAMADLRRLPQGTLPPVVMKVDASSLPVCLLTVEGQGLSETQLHDYLQFSIRNQIAGVPGATVPPPYGGRYRQIMVDVDPLKLQAHQLSPMDVVRAIDESNLILPAGDVRIGPLDYNIYTNAQVPNAAAINDIPLKTEGEKSVFVSDIGKATDSSFLQYNIVRVNGQKSVYVPILKQGGDTNTIAVVNGIREAIKNLRDIPAQLKTHVVFDQSVFVKGAISTVLREGGMGVLLTAIMIWIFLGSLRATAAVFLSIPLSVMITFFVLHSADKTINSMVLSGLALAFSRLIDDSVVVLENVYRHIELGEDPRTAAVNGANEVALPVLAIMLVAIVVFFPVTFLFGVSKYLFSALALAVVIALFASYFDAVTVVPLFCAYFLKAVQHGEASAGSRKSWSERFHAGFNEKFERMLNVYERWVRKALERPRAVVWGFAIFFLLTFVLTPLIGVAFFPRTDAGQFVINVKAPTGTRIELTNDYVKQVEDIIRKIVKPEDLSTIVSNIGVFPDLSALFTPNSGMHTATVDVGLKEDHRVSSFVYMSEVREQVAKQLPQLRTYFQSGGLVDAVLNQGMPAPIDVQVSGMDLKVGDAIAQDLARQIQRLPSVSDVYIPQDMDYPGLELNVNRDRASELGLTPQEIVDNVITALTSDVMIAPSYWVDPKTGNNYFVSVQYPENQVKSIEDLKAMPLRAPNLKMPTFLNQVANVTQIQTPTEVDHYQLERTFDVYVAPTGEDLGAPAKAISKIIAATQLPPNMRVNVRGLVVTMQSSFKSFGIGLLLAVLLVYLILVAQFASFIDPFLIVMAVPTGLVGVIFTLAFTGTTLNIQSLMGIVMLQGMVVSNSILIVDFANVLRSQGHSLVEAVAHSCRIRLRPILMTSLATVVGLLPMAFKLETGSEAYAPLARVIIGGLISSIILTIFVVPAAYLLIYQRRAVPSMAVMPEEAH
ncbi:MAG TPA: efflux RND transporter permease subunit [Candidatus Binatus sp.]|jgi:hydrophobic/amphiphilic exporter-1 (mainly G- bacteria), HAE1 family|nr:efflux RND transporter permease subunit [Candidatus Binatus sp.]